MPDQRHSQDRSHDHDDIRYEWVRHVYAATPAASPTAIDAAVAAVRNAMPDDETIQGRRWTPRRRLVWWTPAAAAIIATVSVAIWVDHHHVDHIGKLPHTAGQTYAKRPDVPIGNPLPGTPPPTVPHKVLSPSGAGIAPPAQSSTMPSVSASQNQTTTANAPSRSNVDSTQGNIPSRSIPTNTPLSASQLALRGHAVEGLDSASATLALRILDSAQAHGLPIAALTARIQEGVRRGTPGPLIVVVTRNLAAALADTRTALGTSTTMAEMQSGAEALLNGVPVAALKQLRAARPTGSIAEPLIALADLSTHGVAPLRASEALAALMAQPGSDTLVRALRAKVVDDIIRGLPADAALADRAHQIENRGLQPPRAPFNRPDSMPIQQGVP